MLAGQKAVITGAGSGIGAAAAKLWAKNGAKVVLADLNARNVENVASDVNKLYPNSAVPIKADVALEKDNVLLLDTCVKSFGGITTFFNNAGVLPTFKPVAEQTEDEFMNTLRVNTLAPFFAIKHASQYMIKHNPAPGKCSIVVTGSLGSIRSFLIPLSYATSKGGVNSLVMIADDQLMEDGIRVNGIMPGGVNTAMAAQAVYPGSYEYDIEAAIRVGKKYPMSEPEEIASLAMFLASDYSSCIKGQMILADKGVSNSVWSSPSPHKKQND